MPIRPLLLLLFCLSAPAPAVAGDPVQVRFVNPEQYKDFTQYTGPLDKAQAEYMSDLGKHLRSLGELYLPKGDTLEIDVEDVDMAGGYEHWRMNNLRWTRILSDVYPPKISIYYLWKDPKGKVKAERRELVTNLNYRSMIGIQEYNSQDPLRYEKALLKLWFLENFRAPVKSRPPG